MKELDSEVISARPRILLFLDEEMDALDEDGPVARQKWEHVAAEEEFEVTALPPALIDILKRGPRVWKFMANI